MPKSPQLIFFANDLQIKVHLNLRASSCQSTQITQWTHCRLPLMNRIWILSLFVLFTWLFKLTLDPHCGTPWALCAVSCPCRRPRPCVARGACWIGGWDHAVLVPCTLETHETVGCESIPITRSTICCAFTQHGSHGDYEEQCVHDFSVRGISFTFIYVFRQGNVFVTVCHHAYQSLVCTMMRNGPVYHNVCTGQIALIRNACNSKQSLFDTFWYFGRNHTNREKSPKFQNSQFDSFWGSRIRTRASRESLEPQNGQIWHFFRG